MCKWGIIVKSCVKITVSWFYMQVYYFHFWLWLTNLKNCAKIDLT